jgi:tRNA dimethylallyltransferase
MNEQKTVLVVTGPTASGKSALALAFAQLRGGCVINADAMQTYDAFPMLTAQPTAEERARVPHALYGVLPLSQNLSAGRWSVMAAAEIERCLAARQMPILCGGSGLYIRTLMQGLSPVPEIPAVIRERGNAEWQSMGAEAFRARLAERDPEIVAMLKPADRQRHVRAWEVLEATGTPLSAWQKAEGTPAPWRFATLLLAPERPWLRARIELRFDQMLGAGVLAEARAVFDTRPDPTWLGLKAHGAPEFFRHFRGELSIDHARRMAIDHTRQYAKRQMTWFRHQLAPDFVVDPLAAQSLGVGEQFLDKTGV